MVVRLPSDIAATMAEFGYAELRGAGSGISAERSWQILSVLLPASQSDPGGLTAALAMTVTPLGGYAAYGASRAVAELVGQPFDGPDGAAVLDGAIRFLRAMGVPPIRVRGYEWSYWVRQGGTAETWLPPRPPPPPHDTGIPPFASGETRMVARITTAPDSNILYAQQQETGRYVALVEARYSDDDPTRGVTVWREADSAYGLYCDVGRALQVPPAWVAAELEPYIPLPPPTIPFT